MIVEGQRNRDLALSLSKGGRALQACFDKLSTGLVGWGCRRPLRLQSGRSGQLGTGPGSGQTEGKGRRQSEQVSQAETSSSPERCLCGACAAACAPPPAHVHGESLEPMQNLSAYADRP